MDLGAAGLSEQPFPTYGNTLATVKYASQQEALRVLRNTLSTPHGLCLFQGPSLSGKSTIIRQFVAGVSSETATAIVDGSGLNTIGLLEAVLRQFGYVLGQSSITELLAMVRVFVLQQASSHEPPLLIVENTHALNPSELRVLCELASLNVRGRSALKLVLVSDRSLLPLIEAPAMSVIYKRLTYDFHLHPMNNTEATEYLYMKLRLAGRAAPEFVFPMPVCTELWRASGGWPGRLDRIALLTLAKAEYLPVSVVLIENPDLPKGTWDTVGYAKTQQKAGLPPRPPTLIISLDGEMLHEITFESPRLLIGRSEHNDIPISSKFISRHHALLVRHGSVTFLMDLNSSNGTFVNSRRVSNHVLIHNDVVMIGNHRIKFDDPHATDRDALESVEFTDTVIMKSLDDMRQLLAQENTALLPTLTENVPTSGIN